MTYTDYKINNCTSCIEDCSCKSCCEKQECGCKMELDTKCNRYTGRALACLGVNTGDNLETIIQKFEEKYCTLSETDCEGAGLALYQLWLDAGNTGTIEDFLNSLIGDNGTNGVDGVNGINGTNGIDGINGAVVLHNDMNVYNRSIIGFLSMTSYTLPAGTLTTDGSKLKIDVLFRSDNGSVVSKFLKLQINGLDAHTLIGDIELVGDPEHGVLSYELHRITNSTIVIRYNVSLSTASGDIVTAKGSYENGALLGVLDFDNNNILIDVLGSGDGALSILQVGGFSVEHYVK